MLAALLNALFNRKRRRWQPHPVGSVCMQFVAALCFVRGAKSSVYFTKSLAKILRERFEHLELG
ncbi:MAG: hypothetical protein BroJett009_05960 [Armatimonadota bacterium]|nr:MAG: hypothetical protein BroJett009_05960 [Armatimonadota bacterium]